MDYKMIIILITQLVKELLEVTKDIESFAATHLGIASFFRLTQICNNKATIGSMNGIDDN